MNNQYCKIKIWQLSFIIPVLAILLSLPFLRAIQAKASSVKSPIDQARNTLDPSLTLKVVDYWNSPVAINKVTLRGRELKPDSSFAAANGWFEHLSIQGVNRSKEPISYIKYAIDFTIAGEKSLYRINLDSGDQFNQPDTKSQLHWPRGGSYLVNAVDKDLKCSSTLMAEINARKANITKVELFVEAVAFDDGALWMFGSWLRRSKETSMIYERIGVDPVSNATNRFSSGISKAFIANGYTRPPYQACTTMDMNYSSGSAGATTIVTSCGGPHCSPPYPTKTVHSLSGQGSSGFGSLTPVSCP